MLHASLEPLLPEIRKILKAHKVKSAYFFGSSLKDTFNDNSDLDIIVNLQEGLDPVEAGEYLWNLIFELEDLTHRKVDLLTERSLKNPYFIETVNQTKWMVYG